MIFRQELEICGGLGWRMLDVTPFRFVGFFIGFLKLAISCSAVNDLIYISQEELEICGGLGWRMLDVTPFRFVGFFIGFLKLIISCSAVNDLIYISQEVVIGPI
ncbi:hypothetical protein CASFOL_002641 [Castilleja foliolosa]|uniref:Uncharacterized protein n=1 Tax=Castilleja foliolosa TaxID=1961234 RepID=A0ABD3EIM1_9LAMI